MIMEDYVSFETAKLLKERGFDEVCISVYHDGELQLVSSLGIFCGEGYGEQILTYTNSECSWSPIMIAAPTLQMTMKWLRKVHNFHILVEPNHDKEGLYNAHVKVGWWSYNWAGIGYNTHEEACEAAIKYCLENLI